MMNNYFDNTTDFKKRTEGENSRNNNGKFLKKIKPYIGNLK